MVGGKLGDFSLFQDKLPFMDAYIPLPGTLQILVRLIFTTFWESKTQGRRRGMMMLLFCQVCWFDKFLAPVEISQTIGSFLPIRFGSALFHTITANHMRLFKL